MTEPSPKGKSEGDPAREEDLSRKPPAADSLPPGSVPPGSVVVEKRRNLPALLVLTVAVVGLLSMTVLIFLPFLAPLILALTIAIVVQPLFRGVLRLIGERRRGLTSIITCILVVLLIFLPFAWLGWSMVDQAQEARDAVAEWAGKLREKLEASSLYKRLKAMSAFRGVLGEGGGEQQGPSAAPPQEKREDGAPRWAGDVIRWVTGTLAEVLTLTFGITIKFVVLFFILYYLLRDGPQILENLKRAVPLEEKYQERVVDTFQKVVLAIVRGALGTALIQGTVATLAFLIVGTPGWIIWGVMAGITSIVPPLGTGWVTLPITLVMFASGSWGQGITLLAFATVIGIVDNILQPLLVGKGMKLHPVWLVVSMLGALSFFGAVGLIYGPMIVALLGTFVALFVREERQEASRVAVAVPPAPGQMPSPPGQSPSPPGQRFGPGSSR